MAENESLDLGNPGGQRWNQFLDAVRKGFTPEKAAEIAQRKLPRALRKAFGELAECGAPFHQFLAARNDSRLLEQLVRRCNGHEYAHLFADTARAEPGSSNESLIFSFLSAIVERVSDQACQPVTGSPNVLSLTMALGYQKQVQRSLQPEYQRISEKLAANPYWNPTRRSRTKIEKADATKQLLSMSIIGIKSR